VSFLRKQQSRLVPAQAGMQVYSRTRRNEGNMDFDFVLECRFRGRDMLG